MESVTTHAEKGAGTKTTLYVGEDEEEEVEEEVEEVEEVGGGRGRDKPHHPLMTCKKVEGRVGGANPVRGGVGVAHHPMRGFGKGFGAEGGFARNERGGARGTTVPLQRTCTLEGGVGDVGDVHLWEDGGMERGDAQILQPWGARKVPREGEKGVVRWCPWSKIQQAHHVAMGGGGTRLVVGYTWTFASLGFLGGVSTHGIEELVNGGGLRGQMQKLKRGELGAEFPPQSCARALPPKIGVAGGAAQVDVNDLGGGVEGC